VSAGTVMKTGSDPWPRHTAMNTIVITPMITSQTDVGSCGSEPPRFDLVGEAVAIGSGAGVGEPPSGPPAAAGTAGTLGGGSPGVPGACTGSPAGCGHMFGYWGPRSHTEPSSDTASTVTVGIRPTAAIGGRFRGSRCCRPTPGNDSADCGLQPGPADLGGRTITAAGVGVHGLCARMTQVPRPLLVPGGAPGATVANRACTRCLSLPR
jgi:hypothetical protein